MQAAKESENKQTNEQMNNRNPEKHDITNAKQTVVTYAPSWMWALFSKALKRRKRREKNVFVLVQLRTPM